MRDFFAYLCGGMGKFGKENFDEGNKWRKYCKQAPLYNTQNEVMRLDLHKLRNSDLVIANFNDMYSLGSMCEIAIAYDRGIPVIGLNESGQTLHTWQECMAERIFNNIDEMLDYIEDFYLR